MLRVWGRLSSINVQKVVWCLDELGLPYERREAGGAYGVVDTPEYRRMNPNGLVPTIEEDGFVLWESNAIVRFLAARHPERGLWPDDPRIRAGADRWMDWQATVGSPALRDAFWQLVRTPEASRDPAIIATSLKRSEDATAILDGWLATNAFMAGERFSAGDIAAGAFAHRWLRMPIERPPRPNLERWYRELQGRPGSGQVLGLPLS